MLRRITEKAQFVPAAQYLRMSTDQQQYSFANQRVAIEEFAAQNGYVVVCSYEDAGKSGLTIRHRLGLQKLLHDVVAGTVAFKAILVYDVSRWGRFLDSDEAAHYEFLCRNSGVPIHYCAEQFTNDGSVPSTILKTLRRSMAGEYVRELSIKIFASQKRIATLGFRPGGPPGYGLRRMAVSSDGKARRKLSPGQDKPYATDHVTLVPGPKKEVAILRRIYETFLGGRGNVGPYDIARQLNRDCIPASHGGPWTPFAVRQVLTNPKYAGVLVWAKTTQRLRTKNKRQPRSVWVINEHAYQPIIRKLDFARAQAVFKKRSEKLIPEHALIQNLQKILSRHGELRQSLISRKTGRFGLSTYQRRFGSMQRIYDLFGLQYPAGLFEGRSHSQIAIHMRNSLVLRILEHFPGEITPFRVSNYARRLNLLLDGRFRVFVWVANYYQTQAGTTGWKLELAPNEKDGLTLLCIMRPDNQDFKALYLFPGLAMQYTQYRFGQDDVLLEKGLRLLDISQLCCAARDMIGGDSLLRSKVEVSATHEPNPAKKRRRGTRRMLSVRVTATPTTPLA